MHLKGNIGLEEGMLSLEGGQRLFSNLFIRGKVKRVHLILCFFFFVLFVYCKLVN